MRIGIEADRANKSQKTGTEWYAFHVIQSFKQIPSSHQFILYSRNALIPSELPAHFSHKELPWKGKLWTQIRLSWYLFKQSPDVLFIPAHTIPTFCPCPIVTTLHDVGFKRFPELYSPIERLYHDWSAWYACKRAKKIITISEFSKQEICHFYQVNPDKIQVVYNGFDQEIYHGQYTQQEMERVRKKYDLHHPYLLYIGRLEKKKNIKRIVESFLKFSEDDSLKYTQCVLVGKKGFGFEEVQSIIQDHPNGKRIRILGWVENEDLPILYAGARVFLFPTLYEGFGIPILEAFGSGVPVITSQGGAHQEIASDAAVLVNPYATLDIVNAIKTVLTNQDMRVHLIQKGKKRAAEFSYDICARKTLQILSEVGRK